jgi:hypothetical protein
MEEGEQNERNVNKWKGNVKDQRQKNDDTEVIKNQK